jgi:hypothetical protein
MKLGWKRSDQYCWNCPNSKCRKSKSVREGSKFFGGEQNKNKLSLYKIIRLLEFLMNRENVRDIAIKIAINPSSVQTWRTRILSTFPQIMEASPKMGGENIIIEIDEMLCRGPKRKNNKGKFQIL